MMQLLYAILVVCGLFLLDDKSSDPKPPPDASAIDLKVMQGTWQLTKGVTNGRPRKTEGVMILVAENTLKTRDGKDEQSGTFKLNGKKNPKEIDLVFPKGKGFRPRPGIYKLEQDVLTLCFTSSNNKRPTRFDEKEGTLLVFKKVKK